MRGLLLAGATALVFSTPLLPTEAIERQGNGVVLAMAWLVLSLMCLALHGFHPVEWKRGARTPFEGESPVAPPEDGQEGGESIDVWLARAATGLLVIIALSALGMASLGNPRQTWNAFWTWVAMIVSFLLIQSLFRGPAERRALASVMLASAVGLASLGVAQPPILKQLWTRYREDPEAVLREAGVHAPAGSPLRHQFEDRLLSREPLGTFALTNSFAGYLAPWLVIGVAIVAGARMGEMSLARLPILVAGLCVVVCCLVMTKSRSGYVATCTGLACLGIVLTRRVGMRAIVLVGGTLVGIAALVVTGLARFGFLDRLVWSEASKSLGYRWEYWQAATAMIGDYPWLGCGPGNFQQYYTAYKLPQSSETVAEPHNFLFEIAATCGIPALVALLVVLGVFFRRLLLRRPGDVGGGGARGAVAPTETLPPGKPIPATKPLPDDPGGVWWIYGGAALGPFLAAVIGYLIELGTLREYWLIGLPATVVAAWALDGWVRRGEWTLAMASIGVVVLLVNLLAAGGLVFPGVAQTLWALLAIAPARGLPGPKRRVPPAVRAALGFLVVLVTIGICSWSAYLPLLGLSPRLAEAELELAFLRFSKARESYRAASKIDPLAFEPWRQLLHVSLQAWRIGLDRDEAMRDLKEAADEAIRRNRHSYTLRREIGDCFLVAHASQPGQGHVRVAVDHYREAARLYPNSAILHAQLALALATAGLTDEARREADEALRLDVLQPHAELKLGKQRLFDGNDEAADNGPLAEPWLRELLGQ